jgi:hypothetical protein
MDDSYLQFVVSLLDDTHDSSELHNQFESSDPDDCKFLDILIIMILMQNYSSPTSNRIHVA